MTTIDVPSDHPLTHAHAGMTIYVVLPVEDSGESCGGGYPTVTRALEYIKDWIHTGDRSAVVSEPYTITDGHEWGVSVNDVPAYTIQKTHFRL